jgi:hypothetical protein
LTSGTVLAAPISELVQPHASPEKSDETSLVSIDRQHILKALKDSDGRISGPRGLKRFSAVSATPFDDRSVPFCWA